MTWKKISHFDSLNKWHTQYEAFLKAKSSKFGVLWNCFSKIKWIGHLVVLGFIECWRKYFKIKKDLSKNDNILLNFDFDSCFLKFEENWPLWFFCTLQPYYAHLVGSIDFDLFAQHMHTEAVFLVMLGTSSFPVRHELQLFSHIPRAQLGTSSYPARLQIPPLVTHAQAVEPL